MTTKSVKFWIAIDEEGDVSISLDSAADAAAGNDLGAVNALNRVFEIDMTLPLPKPTSVSAVIPDTDGPVTVTVNT